MKELGIVQITLERIEQITNEQPIDFTGIAPLRMGTVCSGIGAPEVAALGLPVVPVWSSEIEPLPCRVLKHHYPGVPNLGDMTKLYTNETFIKEPIDLLIGGTPCQSFSIAGLRGGLDDERGNLALVFARILLVKQPRWFLWENVPGVFSSFSPDEASATAAQPRDSEAMERGGNTAGGRGGLGLFDTLPDPTSGGTDRGEEGDNGDISGGQSGHGDERYVDETSDLAAILCGFRECGYSVSYRILDSQHFGVPQRRRRIIVVGHLGDDWRPSAAVLFERDSLRRDLAPRREARQEAAGTSGAGAEVAIRYGEHQQDTLHHGEGLMSGLPKGTHGAAAHFTNTIAPIACETADSLTIGANQTTGFCGDVVATLGKIDEDHKFFSIQRIGEYTESANTHTLSKRDYKDATDLVTAPINGTQVGRWWDGGDTTATLTKSSANQYMPDKNNFQAVTVPFTQSIDCSNDTTNDEISGTLQSKSNGGQSLNYVNPVMIGQRYFKTRGISDFVESDSSGLVGSMAPYDGVDLITTHIARRLTPTECLRLQGFPDDYLDIDKASDSAKYAAVGNSMTTFVIRWVIRRMLIWEKIQLKLKLAA